MAEQDWDSLVAWTQLRILGRLDRGRYVGGVPAVPCALFALGAALSSYAIEGVLGRSLAVVVIKNLLLPFLVWWVSGRLGLPTVWQAIMVVMAALPVGINTYLFAERYQCGQALAGTAVVLSTGVSVVTLSVILSVLA